MVVAAEGVGPQGHPHGTAVKQPQDKRAALHPAHDTAGQMEVTADAARVSHMAESVAGVRPARQRPGPSRKLMGPRRGRVLGPEKPSQSTRARQFWEGRMGLSSASTFPGSALENGSVSNIRPLTPHRPG